MGNTNEDIQTLMKAFDFSAIKHKNQRRKDLMQTPYINHPIGVAQIISKAGITDTNILVSAVLHDTVEDTDTTLDEIETEFGKEIRGIVDECSDDKSLSKEERKRLQIEKAPLSSYEAKVVKLADKLYNLRDLEREIPIGWTEERVQEYFVWSSLVVKGLRGTCLSIENQLDIMFEKRKVLLG